MILCCTQDTHTRTHVWHPRMPAREADGADRHFFQQLGVVTLHLFVLSRTFSWTLWITWCPALDLLAMAAPESHALVLYGLWCVNAVVAMCVQLDWTEQPWFAAYLLVWFACRYRDVIVIALCLVGLCAGVPLGLAANLILLGCGLVRTSRWCRSKTWRERYETLGVHTPTGEDSAEPCCICFDTRPANHPWRRLGCGHTFHQDCIDGWILGDCRCDCTRHQSCPVCRRDAVTSHPTHTRGSGARRV